MKAEYTVEDFSKVVKNPYFDKLARKAEVTVRHEDYQTFCEIAQQNGVNPEDIMYRCLVSYAKKMREYDE